MRPFEILVVLLSPAFFVVGLLSGRVALSKDAARRSPGTTA
jgi:hypothetical protein